MIAFAIAVLVGCTGGKGSATSPTTTSLGTGTSESTGSSTSDRSNTTDASSSSSASGPFIPSAGGVFSRSGPEIKDASGDPVFDANGNVDADVVVQSFDTLRFDKKEYDGKADLTIGLFDQGSMHHTLRIVGRDDFRLDVFLLGEARIADIKLDHGSYTVYCELEGHRSAGMEATLVIP